MAATARPAPPLDHPDWPVFVAAMAARPGDLTPVLVAADWLDEHDAADLADAVRTCSPALARRHRAAAACLDALLAVDAAALAPAGLPPPDRSGWRSRRQWVAIVRAALRPLRVPGLTVARAPFGGGAEVEVRVPPAGGRVAGPNRSGFVVPWAPDDRQLLAAGGLALSAVMAALFPGEPPRPVHFDGETWFTPFWRLGQRTR